MDDAVRVDCCVCVNVRFDTLKQQYDNLAAAQAATACGVECGGCMPYLNLVFATGETSFDIEDPRLPLQ